jgi:hypothetical protein
MSFTAISRVRAGLLVIAMSVATGSCEQQPLTAGLEPEPVSPPVLALSTSSADFSAIAHSLAPMQVIAISNAGAGTLGGLGIGSIQYAGEGSDWLTVSLTSNTAPATLTLQAAAGNLAAGTYYARINLVATGATNSPREIDVSFRVDALEVGPIIGLTATAAAFSAVAGGPGVAQVVQILGASDAPLSGLAITDVTYGAGANDWLAASLSSTSAPANLILAPNAQALLPGTYAAVVSVSAPGAINSPRTVRITLTVTTAVVPASLRLGTTAVGFSGTAATPPASQSVGITNGGGGSLDGLTAGPISYAGSATGWLQANLSTTSAPSILTLTPSLVGMAPGVYSASVPVSAPTALGSPQVVTVSLTVAGTVNPPALSIAPSAMSFSATAGGSPPTAKTIAISNSGGGTLANLSIGLINYSAGASGWLQPALTSNTAPATLTLSPVVTGLAAGSYTAVVPISSPDASNGIQVVTVSLTVTSVPLPPSIGLSTSTLTYFGTSGGSTPPAQVVTISNAGGGTLSGLTVGVITYGAGATGWLSATLAASSAPTTLTLTPTLGALAAGTYTATVPISAPGAANTPQSVAVTFTVAAVPPPPSISLSPSSQSFSATAGGSSPAAKTVNVSNVGGGTLSGLTVGVITYGAGATGWLSATLAASSAPTTLTLTPTLGALVAGTYTATVPISAPGAANTPQSVAVTFTVAAATGISFTTDIYPTFQANCLSSGCHVPLKQAPDLSTKSIAYTKLVTATTKYVIAGDSTRGMLKDLLQGTGGAPVMPPAGKLSTAFISKVKLWIQQGAPNN